MTDQNYSYTNAQFQDALSKTIKKLLGKHAAKPVPRPYAYLLGGQSGAGKSTLHKVLDEHFDGNVIVINGDEYRKSHPHFSEIQQQYGLDAPAHTAQWSGAMTEALIDGLSEQHYNLIIEGTLRASAVPLETAELLRGRSYNASLAIMAVKPGISLVSCQIRYELMRLAGTTPRATDPEHHNGIVHDIVSNLSTLETSGLFDAILLYDRASTRLFPTADDQRTASEALHEIIFGPWMPEETEHYEDLQAQLEELRGC